MPGAARCMYRYVTLFDGMLRGDLECSDDTQTQLISCQLRLRLAVTAVSSTKVSFDLALAGYYSQAFAILRHMLETWQVMAYLRVCPESWRLWYPSPNGNPPNPPDQQTMANRLRRPGVGFPEIRTNALEVERLVRGCHAGAHPSILAMSQPETGVNSQMQLGGNFNRRYLRDWYSVATAASALLVHEIEFTVARDQWYKREFEELALARNAWFDAEHSDNAAQER